MVANLYLVRISKPFAMDCNPVVAKTCPLKMQLKCETCQNKVKKVLQKIHGVHSISIDANDGTVAFSSTVDPRLFIAMLAKAGKKAELLWELPQRAPVNSPNPQVDQPFRNVQMAPPGPPPASNLQASGFDHVQLQELAKIPGLKHMELNDSRNIKLVFKNHNDDFCHGKNHAMKVILDSQLAPQLYKGSANVEPPTRIGHHGNVTKNMHENSSHDFVLSCGAGPSGVGNRCAEEQHMQMNPMVYYGPSPVRYHAHPFATPPHHYGYGVLQPTNLPYGHFNCSHDDGKCIVM